MLFGGRLLLLRETNIVRKPCSIQISFTLSCRAFSLVLAGFTYICHLAPNILKSTYDFSKSPLIDQVGVEERVARFNTRSIKKSSKVEGLKIAINMIDLTTLEGKDTEGKVRQLCYKAQHLH